MPEMELTLKEVFDSIDPSTYVYLWTKVWRMRGFKLDVYDATVNYSETHNSNLLQEKVFDYNSRSGVVSDLDIPGEVDIVNIYMYDTNRSLL